MILNKNFTKCTNKGKTNVTNVCADQFDVCVHCTYSTCRFTILFKPTLAKQHGIVSGNGARV